MNRSAGIVTLCATLLFLILLLRAAMQEFTPAGAGPHRTSAAAGGGIAAVTIEKITIRRGGGFGLDGSYDVSIHRGGCTYIRTPRGIFVDTESTSVDYSLVRSVVDKVIEEARLGPAPKHLLDVSGYVLSTYGMGGRPIDSVYVGPGSNPDEYRNLERLESAFFRAYRIPVRYRGGYPGCVWHPNEFSWTHGR